MTVTLRTMRDQFRPLLVFAATDQDPNFLKQIHLFVAAGHEMHQREVLFVPLNEKTEAKSLNSMLDYGRMSSEEADAMRLRFHVPSGSFTVILVGKDGGEKLRSHTPLSAERLIQTIDAMPMRQQEMLERKQRPKSP